jgi:hypothetical protein
MEINEFVMANEKVIRLGAFFGILGTAHDHGIARDRNVSPEVVKKDTITRR